MKTMENTPAARKRRSFTDEFKKDAAAMVIDDGRAINEVAKALGVGASTLGVWVRQERINRGTLEGLTTDQTRELADLKKENAQLRMERDLLKRATAFWVKDVGGNSASST